ncbi:BTB/POZ domain-containing protein [Zea mays]|nr:BTB/POZ domain-containing protein [Zea mays]
MRKGKAPMNESGEELLMDSKLQNLKLHDNSGNEIPHNIIAISDMNGEAPKRMENDCSTGGPSGESTSYQFNENNWLSSEQTANNYFSRTFSSGVVPTEWGRPNAPLWGGRVIGRRQVRCIRGSSCLSTDEYNTFMNIFERGSLLYCNMSFDALLSVRKQLEEFGFPCKAVNDGLWLQMLLCHRVQAIVADTCRNCCLTNNSCACKQAYVSSHTHHYRQEHDRSSVSGTIGNVYLADAQGDGNGVLGPVRVNVRGAVDGLAGIGRGNSNVPGAAWAPTRYVFSRVPYGLGSRNAQQFANDESEPRIDRNGDISADGLTALVNLSQENSAAHPQAESLFETGMQTRYHSVASVSTPGGSSVQMQESKEHDWETAEDATISLDMKTPLSHFPPFRFGVEFDDVHRLADGHVKHSTEVFYAGSLWKVSVQAFNDEDPHGRRTLGLFLHRRKAELLDPLRKAHLYVDPREKVTARYQLICPSKREVMVFGCLKQAGTLLPKAPKGWGWRTAILFDELADLLQGGALRIAAVVQLV